MLKILISLIVGLAIGTSLTFSLVPEKNNTNNTKELSATDPITNSSSKDLNNNLLRENATLLEALRNAKAELKKTSASSIVNHYAAKTSPDCISEVTNAISAFNEKDKIVSELQNVKSLHDYDTNLYNQFINEEPNEAWAKNVEHKFYDALNKNPDIQTLAISSLDCRSATCKINIPIANQLTKDQAIEIMSDESFLKALGFKNSSIRSAMEITGGEMTFYISNHP